MTDQRKATHVLVTEKLKKRLSVRRLLLLVVDIGATLLTLITGLQENPVVVFITGRYDNIRLRLQTKSISYDIVDMSLFDNTVLPDLDTVGSSWRFVTAPRRGANVAENRSTCLRVNSVNASTFVFNYDDFWGRNVRRQQFYLFSISPSKCDVINLKPAWVATCVDQRSTLNQTNGCYDYILDNFDILKRNRLIQAGIEKTFGEPGRPFLRCLHRPEKQFIYITDILCVQSYWAGGSFHVEVQSSQCRAVPRSRDSQWQYTLFETLSVDDAADVLFAVDSTGWFVTIVGFVYGIVSIALILRGIMTALVRANLVSYIPSKLRHGHGKWYGRLLSPTLSITLLLTADEHATVTFKGAKMMASDVWMNHWFYISMSILDAVVNLRIIYNTLDMGQYMLSKQINLKNFLFACGAISKLTWLMCFVHTVLRWVLQLSIRSLKAFRIVKEPLREKLEWYIDAWALMMSYKIYSVLLCIILGTMLMVNLSTTLMVPALAFKTGVFGGFSNLTDFWHNGIVCDYVVIFGFLTGAGFVVANLMLMTKLKRVTRNGFIKLLQERYMWVGWDLFVTMEAIGMDPFDSTRVQDDVALTHCSLGCILQQLYASGPSGLVALLGDYIFTDGGFSNVVEFAFPLRQAKKMLLYKSKNGTALSSAAKYTVATASHPHTNGNGHDNTHKDEHGKPDDHATDDSAVSQNSKSIFDRILNIHAEWRWGRILLVDKEEFPGKLRKEHADSLPDFVVRDALSLLTIRDSKPLMGVDQALRVR